MSYVTNSLKYNFKYFLLAFSLLSEAIVPIPFRNYFYYIGIIYIFSYSLKNSDGYNKFGMYYVLFLTACFISSCFALILNYRLFAFIALIISCTPITHSFNIYLFRKKYLYYSLITFPILAIASAICYFTGINYYTPNHGININILDFSAFFPHPLWLGAALGLSNIVLVWLIFTTRNKTYKITFSIILLLSLYISIVAASRSAFFSSAITMIILLLIKLHNIKKIIITGSVLTIVTIILLPIYLTGATRMQDKFTNSRGKYGSRTELVVSGLSNFQQNPLLGQGFAISYNAKGEKIVGRMESGSGWLSILSQTGIIGFTIICILLVKVRKIFPYIFNDDKLLLYFCSFLYLCLHSGFEGYLLTIGYYPCILFWMLLGFLHIYPYYKHIENEYISWKLNNIK